MAVYCTIVKLVTYVDPFYLYFIQFVLFVISATPFSFEYLLRSAHTKGLVSSTEGRTDVRSESHLMGAPLARRRRAGAPLSLSIFPVFLNKLHKFMNVTIPWACIILATNASHIIISHNKSYIVFMCLLATKLSNCTYSKGIPSVEKGRNKASVWWV